MAKVNELDRKRFMPLLALVLLAGAAIGGSAVLWFTASYTSTGKFTALDYLGVYSNEGCTIKLTTHDFGSIHSGDVKTLNVWVKNEGERACALTWGFTSSGFGPGTLWELTYMSIPTPPGGNLGASVAPGTVLPMVFTLKAGSDVPIGTNISITTSFLANST